MGYSENLMQGVETVCTLEFSAERKCMSTVVKGYLGKKNNQVLMKGAPEMVLDKCDKTLNQKGEQPMNDKMRNELKAQVKKVASQGYRVLGIATGLDGGNMKDITAENSHTLLADTTSYAHREAGLAFIGYVCIKDPCREEVKPSIEACKTAGISVIMITGDAKETAISIARELNILSDGQDITKSCFTGSEFQALSAEQKKNILSGSQGKVFSRVEPRHKRELVKILIEKVSHKRPMLTDLIG